MGIYILKRRYKKMPIVKIIMQIISLIIVAVGVIMIYDARKISKKWFSFGEQNSTTKVLKIVGFIIAIIGSLIVILN